MSSPNRKCSPGKQILIKGGKDKGKCINRKSPRAKAILSSRKSYRKQAGKSYKAKTRRDLSKKKKSRSLSRLQRSARRSASRMGRHGASPLFSYKETAAMSRKQALKEQAELSKLSRSPGFRGSPDLASALAARKASMPQEKVVGGGWFGGKSELQKLQEKEQEIINSNGGKGFMVSAGEQAKKQLHQVRQQIKKLIGGGDASVDDIY